MLKSALPLIALLCLSSGCHAPGHVAAYPRSLSFPDGIYDGFPTMAFPPYLGRVGWVFCEDEKQAEIVLVLETTIPGVKSHLHTHALPLRRVLLYDVDGRQKEEARRTALGFGAGSVSRTGQPLGSLGGSFRMSDKDAPQAAIEVCYYWTSKDGEKGSVRVEVPLIIGLAEEWALSDTVRMKVSYREPNR